MFFGRTLARVSGSRDDLASLAESHRRLGILLGNIDRRTDARRAALQAVDLLDRLVAAVPGESRYQKLLADAETALGGVSEGLEKETMYRRSLALRQKMVAVDPADDEQQLGLAGCYINLGVFLGKERAVEGYRRALPIEEKLVADHPDRPRYRSVLAMTLSNLGFQLVWLGRGEEAEQAMRQCRDVAEKLAADFPDTPDHRYRLAGVSEGLGRLLLERGKPGEARESLERAYATMHRLAKDYPDLPAYRHDAAVICYAVAVSYATMSGRQARDVARALELARESVAIEPEEPGFWKGLAVTEYRAGDLDAALKAETRALELRKGSGYRYDWLNLALIHFARGDRRLARAWFGRAYLDKAAVGGWGDEADLRRLGAEAETLLQELIPRTPDDVRHVWTVLLEDLRQRFGASHPDTLYAMESLGGLLVDLGRESQALALFEESRRLRPDRYSTAWPACGPWFPIAILTLRHGDRVGYRALCSDMLQRFEGTKEPVVAEQIARMCTLIPGAVDDPRRALELGRRAAAADLNQPHFLLARGASEYRSGQFQAAVATLADSMRKNDRPLSLAQAALLLAMAHARLGHNDEARRALAEADRSLARLPEKPDIFTLQRVWPWWEREMSQVLLREAAAVVLDPAFPTDPFHH